MEGTPGKEATPSHSQGQRLSILSPSRPNGQQLTAGSCMALIDLNYNKPVPNEQDSNPTHCWFYQPRNQDIYVYTHAHICAVCPTKPSRTTSQAGLVSFPAFPNFLCNARAFAFEALGPDHRQLDGVPAVPVQGDGGLLQEGRLLGAHEEVAPRDPDVRGVQAQVLQTETETTEKTVGFGSGGVAKKNISLAFLPKLLLYCPLIHCGRPFGPGALFCRRKLPALPTPGGNAPWRQLEQCRPHKKTSNGWGLAGGSKFHPVRVPTEDNE